MQFISMTVEDRTQLIKILVAIPAEWRQIVGQRLIELIRDVCRSTTLNDIIVRRTTDVSAIIARALKNQSLLTTCTVSEERLITINIPIGDEFYQIRIQPIAGTSELKLMMFHPESEMGCSAALFYGPIAAKMTYELGLGERRVDLDGEDVSVAAWNAMCATCAAQGSDGVVGILMDMARDGVI